LAYTCQVGGRRLRQSRRSALPSGNGSDRGAGWVYAYSTQMRSQDQVSRAKGKSSRLYVLFWNKGYFDEIYDAYLVTPTLKFSKWLWQVIDIKFIDNFIRSIATYTVHLAGWLWQVIDTQFIDRVAQYTGAFSVKFSERLLQIVDIQWLDVKVKKAAGQAEVDPSTIQHQLLVIVFWLVVMTGLLYSLV